MLITMSDKEIQRIAVLQDVRDRRITQVRAAEILNLSTHNRRAWELHADGTWIQCQPGSGQPVYIAQQQLMNQIF